MSLDYNFTTAEPANHDWMKANWPVTRTMIFAMMALDMGEISAKTLDEVALRLDIYQSLHGALLEDGDGCPLRIDRSHLDHMIGLRVNVTQISRAAWLKHMVEVVIRERKAGRRV